MEKSIQYIFKLLTNNCKRIIPNNEIINNDKLKLKTNILFYNDIIFDNILIASFNYNLVDYKNINKLLPKHFIKSNWIFYLEINNTNNNLYFFLNINKYSDNYNKLCLISDNINLDNNMMDIYDYYNCILLNFRNQFKIINNNLYFIGSTKILQKKFLIFYIFLSSFNINLYKFLSKLYKL